MDRAAIARGESLSFLMTRRLMIVMLALTTIVACGKSKANLPAAGSVDADKYLFDHGTDALERKHWIEGREYFRKLVDTYPQSPFRQEAKLGIGDSYLGENSIESNILAVNEFKEFLSFFPGNARTDYAQYKVALAYAQQMLGSDRDPTPAQDALAATDLFARNFPTSQYADEVQKVRRQALDNISGHDYKVGLFYYRRRWYPGAIERFKALLEKDPEFPQRDAIFFYLGEMYHLSKQDAQALPYFDRVVKEFAKSDFLERAQKGIDEIDQAGTVKR
jgi:outer membrane protein assembly factor BamD